MQYIKGGKEGKKYYFHLGKKEYFGKKFTQGADKIYFVCYNYFVVCNFLTNDAIYKTWKIKQKNYEKLTKKVENRTEINTYTKKLTIAYSFFWSYTKSDIGNNFYFLQKKSQNLHFWDYFYLNTFKIKLNFEYYLTGKCKRPQFIGMSG